MAQEQPAVPESYLADWDMSEAAAIDPASLSAEQQSGLVAVQERFWCDDAADALRQARLIGESVVQYAVSGNPAHIWQAPDGYIVPAGLPRAESMGINMAVMAHQLHPDRAAIDSLIRFGLQAVQVGTTLGPLLVRRSVNGSLTNAWYTPRSLHMAHS